MDVFVQIHSFIYLFFIELAVSTTGQAHKNLTSGSSQQVCSSEASDPDPVEAVTWR